MERKIERFILCVSPNHTMPEGMVELYPRATSAGMFDFQAQKLELEKLSKVWMRHMSISQD